MPQPSNNLSTKPLYDFLQKQKDNEKLYRSMEIGVTFFFITFFLIFAIRPTALTISSLIGEIAAKEESSKLMRTKINDIMRAQEVFSQIQGRYQVINDALPESQAYANTAAQVIGVASKNHIPLNKLAFNVSNINSKEGDLKKFNSISVPGYSVKMSLEGSYDNVTNFLSDIISTRRPFTIDSIIFGKKEVDLNHPETVSTSTTVNISFYLFTYFWPPVNAKK